MLSDVAFFDAGSRNVGQQNRPRPHPVDAECRCQVDTFGPVFGVGQRIEDFAEHRVGDIDGIFDQAVDDCPGWSCDAGFVDESHDDARLGERVPARRGLRIAGQPRLGGHIDAVVFANLTSQCRDRIHTTGNRNPLRGIRERIYRHHGDRSEQAFLHHRCREPGSWIENVVDEFPEAELKPNCLFECHRGENSARRTDVDGFLRELEFDRKREIRPHEHPVEPLPVRNQLQRVRGDAVDEVPGGGVDAAGPPIAVDGDDDRHNGGAAAHRVFAPGVRAFEHDRAARCGVALPGDVGRDVVGDLALFAVLVVEDLDQERGFTDALVEVLLLPRLVGGAHHEPGIEGVEVDQADLPYSVVKFQAGCRAPAGLASWFHLPHSDTGLRGLLSGEGQPREVRRRPEVPQCDSFGRSFCPSTWQIPAPSGRPDRRNTLGEREAEGAQGHPGTAKYGCTLNAKVTPVGRSRRSLGRCTQARGLLGLPGLGYCTEPGTHAGTALSMPTAMWEPSESAFTGRLCVIGNGAVAHLTGDDHAGKACHPCWCLRAQRPRRESWLNSQNRFGRISSYGVRVC